MGMNFFEQELRRLVKACDGITNPTFAGRAAYADLGGDNRAKLQFVTTGYADHYSSLKATVFNRVDGEVDTLLFRFDDVWGKKQVSNPNFRDGVIPYIWTYSGKSEWYAYRPTDADMKQLAASVSAYLDVFTDKSKTRERFDEKTSVVKKLREPKQKATTDKTAPTPKKSELEL